MEHFDAAEYELSLDDILKSRALEKPGSHTQHIYKIKEFKSSEPSQGI